jgi:hypothetical protein
MVEERLITAIWILLMMYLAYRFFTKKYTVPPEDNMKDILNSDKYKVKGQHD